MAEESQAPRYVKLTRDQEAPAEDICPGELNQPINVPRPGCRRCAECGQVLPESYQLPADEPWSTGIFGCTADPASCTGRLAEREDGVQMTIVDAPPVEEMGMPRESSCCL
ncbi:unnamed protein product [Triticum turgidum subsp. durum]|uniref:Uncharacterized protein n=1 Tax=Triticum turgidum subsp. durum TaxID=4567 RepID=A0A9R0WGJ8_TRITD|nr:unnamed protein product [Triticum turgidum subsp. durum]